MVAPKSKKSVNRAKKQGKHPQLPSSLLQSNAPSFKKKWTKSKPALGSADLYEYDEKETVLKRGRSNVKLSLDREELQTGTHSSDEDVENENGVGSSSRMPRLYGAGDDDEEFASDDDEDIDSDEAFEEEDVDKYAGFTFRSSKAGKGKPKGKEKAAISNKSVRRSHVMDVDLDEDEDSGRAGPSHSIRDVGESLEDGGSDDEEEEEEGEDGDFIDVLDIMDGRGVVEEGDDPAPNVERVEKSHRRPASPGEEDDVEGNNDIMAGSEGEESGDDDDGGDEEKDDEEELMISGEEDEGVDLMSALDNLDRFVSTLSTSKRKADDEEPEDAPVKDGKSKKKARFIQDVTEAGTAEGEFGARPTGSSKLSLDDLITSLSTQPNSSVDSLKKAVKPLGTSSAKNQPLPAPLPTRTQEKIDREAAYEQTKMEADKWNETMRRIKEAEHLSFPLQVQKEGKPSNLELTAKFKPTTELESSVDKLLKSAKLREEDIAKTEELMMNHLSVEEVTERRAQLRKMRDLMFRADIKAKRLSKIKSKTYRRLRKKEKEKLLAKLDTAGGVDEDDEEARLKRDVERARERATLKHKNTGKWARAMKSRGQLDEDQRRDINEMLEKGERLRKKIAGVASDEESEEDDSDGGDGDESNALSRIKANAFDELERLQANGSQDGLDANGESHKAKSVFEMKFMKDAAVRQEREVNREMDDFRKEITDLTDNEDEQGVVPFHADDSTPSMTVERVGGRMVYKPGPQSQSQSSPSQTSAFMPPPPPSSISETSTLQSHEMRVLSPVNETSAPQRNGLSLSQSSPVATLSFSSASVTDPNPWLQLGEGPSSKVSRKKNEVMLGRDVSLAQKSEARMKSQLSKTVEGRAQAVDDAIVELDEANAMTVEPKASNGGLESSKRKKEKKNKKKASKTNIDAGASESDGDGEKEAQEEALLRGGKGVRAFEQRDLVARAFAGDNVMRQFEEVKRKEIEIDAPREKDTTLPGWGTWGGVGTKKVPPKPHLVKKIAGIDPKSRADYNKAHVIISEKRDKKAAKYTIKDLPYPYTSKAQFEQSMDTPLGTEWNTRVGFQRGTLPKVVKKMGTVINPLEKQF